MSINFVDQANAANHYTAPPPTCVYVLAVGGFVSSLPFGRQRLMGDETVRIHLAAVVLQKYFRMWLAQSRLTRLQLDAVGKVSDDERILFPQQFPDVSRF